VLKDQLPHYRLARGNTKYCRATDPASRASEIDIFEVSAMLSACRRPAEEIFFEGHDKLRHIGHRTPPIFGSV